MKSNSQMPISSPFILFSKYSQCPLWCKVLMDDTNQCDTEFLASGRAYRCLLLPNMNAHNLSVTLV